MTIKGTLETFNLLDLLQMLSFNQKVGTLVLETAGGPRTLYVERGSFGFVAGDALPSRALARVLRRASAVPADRLERGLSITSNSGRFLGDVLLELGALDPERRGSTWVESVNELFFDLLQTPITRFEFVEGKALAPDGSEGQAVQPLCGVDGVLLELTRKTDEWSILRREVGPEDEVYETTDVSPDLYEVAKDPAHLAERVLPLINGRRTVSALVADSDCDRFSVMKLLSSLLKQGAARVADTPSLIARAEDLISRGAANEAVPLLRRAIDRGEAPPATRIRLADALEAAGDERAAATELDTYASSSEEADPAGVFDCLRRGMRIRGGDAATAARLCDHFLKHRSHLLDRAQDAQEALRRLIHAASTGGRPLEAAARLAAFVDSGDAPGEDLLVLADLYASGGRPVEAASALAKRADELLGSGRPVAAREILRRALGYDPTRIDVRRRLEDLEGADRRRRHRRRMVLLLGLLTLVVGSAGAVYLVYDGRTAKTVEDAITKAEAATRDAEAKMAIALASWNQALGAASSAGARDGALAEAAAALHAEAERLSASLKGALAAASTDLTSLSASTHGDAGLSRLHDFEARQKNLVLRAESAVKDASVRADKALAAGEAAFAEGRFREARPLLSQVLSLSLGAPTRVERARQRLGQVDGYVADFTKARVALDAAAATGDTSETWKLGAKIFAQFLDSDLTHEVRLPVPVVSMPAGASLRLGHDTIPATTPLVVRYSPFGDLDLHLRAPGRVPVAVRLPSYKDILEAEKGKGSAPFHVSVELPAGPRWTASPAGGISAGPFLSGDAILVATGDGRSLSSVRSADGEVADAAALGRAQEKVRLLGRGGGGTWMLLGQRTFAFHGDGGASWQAQTLGRLELAPAIAGTFAVLVDETGTANGVDLSTGAVRWRKSLSSAPSQPPYPSAVGYLAGTIGGEAVALSASAGEARALFAPDPTHPSHLAPWGDGVLVLGGTSPGLATLDAAGNRTPLGATAAPDLSVRPTVTPDGIAWLEAGVVRWLSRAGSPKVIDVPGAGLPAYPVAVADGTVYAVGRDGVLRAARIDAPDATAWSLKLARSPRSGATVHGDLVLLRTEGGLVAVER